MRTELTMRREQARPTVSGQAVERGGWRSHTFADGVRSLTLVGPLDAALAGRLWTRIAELVAHGARRLILDASAIDPDGSGPTLLAAAFAGQPASCEAVVVAPSGSSLTERLPASIGVARSLTDAHRQLVYGLVRQHAGRRPPAPAGRLPAAERHALAIRQSLRWAKRAAHEGDYERALAWLHMVERVEGRLPEEWQKTRESWNAAWRARAPQ